MSKLEQVARAIAKASGDDPEGLTGSLLNEDERYWQQYIPQARAAVESLRDPVGIYPHQLTAWQGIIDGILKDGK